MQVPPSEFSPLKGLAGLCVTLMALMKILAATPPMTQLNTPYPATAYLAGFLKTIGRECDQVDFSLELALKIFSGAGLKKIAEVIRESEHSPTAATQFFLSHFNSYLAVVEPTLAFLQGRDPSLALRIVSRTFLPEGPRFQALENFESLDWAFGALGVQDLAKHLASLFIDDLADVVREGVDARFELARYGEKLASAQASFEDMNQALLAEPSLIDQMIWDLVDEMVETYEPDLLLLSAPFPGNMYGALRMGQRIKQLRPKVRVILGGGYPNTELRKLSDPRVFNFVDFITLDDGEKPLACLLEHLEGHRPVEMLLRTYICKEGKVVYVSNPNEHDIPQSKTGLPTYRGLKLQSYLQLMEMLNPMHRIWSDGRWNKLTLAHGCYWRKCNFCDITVDYIGRYEPSSVDLIINRMVALKNETGQSGFHFVDEACPPALLKNLALRLIERNVVVTWWGNIRFEKAFDSELTDLLAQSGCIAVSGGLEVASDRLLKLMNKGVTVEQVARVSRNFTESGVLVHAYLMYGFPTQTTVETVESLERVRQLFESGVVTSAFWHRFTATVHSPIGQNPERFGISLRQREPVTFAENDLPFDDPTPCDHEMLGRGLRKALYNFMHGVGLDLDVRSWFEETVPKPKVPRNLIEAALTRSGDHTKKTRSQKSQAPSLSV